MSSRTITTLPDAETVAAEAAALTLAIAKEAVEARGR